ncbi:MAG TPA: amidohydrolase family protein [Desulfomonilaceae bacterium]|nr:amidohydrolase family protein [Desulfomonilaceae bacterium]
MLVDIHCHIFNRQIVKNMNDRPALVEELKLNVHDSIPRLDPHALQESAQLHGIDLCVLLPTAAPARVSAENDRFMAFANQFSRIRTFATLHPMMHHLSEEIRRMLDLGIIGFKFSSFSQRFDLLSPEAAFMLAELERATHSGSVQPIVVFDTFVRGDSYFGTDPKHITTPSKLARLVRRHPGLVFVGAHMGGLLADFDQLRRELRPEPNLYVDTSNAAHIFTERQFVELLQIHGSSRVLFGTDWPWFYHSAELPKIKSLLAKAGYDETDQAAVLGGNARRILGVPEPARIDEIAG